MSSNAQAMLLPDADPVPTEGGASFKAAPPIRRQYLQIKRRFPDTILLFRLGDFYETFEDDAEIAARVLDIVLTSREMGKGVRVPMAGIPHHAADGHIARLVAAGHKVAICEQIGGLDRGRTLIDRDVTRIVTPGTVTDPAMLNSHCNTYIAAVVCERSRAGIAYADLSTGEFAATQLVARSPDEVHAAAGREVQRLGAVEIVLPADLEQADGARTGQWLPVSTAVSYTDSWHWKPERARETLLQHFGVQSLDGFGLAEQRMAVQAAGALLAYLAETQRSALVQITAIHTYSASGFMELDLQARRNLELAESARGEKRHGLLAVLDETRTAMGARLLRRWLGQPLLDLEKIQLRQDAVEQYVADTVARAAIRQALNKIGDIERLANRALTGAISPRELGVLRQSLELVAVIAAEAANVPGSPSLQGVLGRLPEPFRSSCVAHCQTILLLRSVMAMRSGPGSLPNWTSTTGLCVKREPGSRDSSDRSGSARGSAPSRLAITAYSVTTSRSAPTPWPRPKRSERLRRSRPQSCRAEYQVRQSLANATRYVTAQLKEAEAGCWEPRRSWLTWKPTCCSASWPKWRRMSRYCARPPPQSPTST